MKVQCVSTLTNGILLFYSEIRNVVRTKSTPSRKNRMCRKNINFSLLFTQVPGG